MMKTPTLQLAAAASSTSNTTSTAPPPLSASAKIPCEGGCGASRVDAKNRATLLPCRHVLCLHCLIQVQAARGSNRLQCPSCGEIVTQHEWMPPTRNRRSSSSSSSSSSARNKSNNSNNNNSNNTIITVVEHPYGPPRDLHPMHDAFRSFMRRTFQNKSAEERQEIVGAKGILFNALYHIRWNPTATATAHDDKPEITLVQCRNVSANGERLPSLQDQQALVWTMQVLHQAVRSLRDVAMDASTTTADDGRAMEEQENEHHDADKKQTANINESTTVTRDFAALCEYIRDLW